MGMFLRRAKNSPLQFAKKTWSHQEGKKQLKKKGMISAKDSKSRVSQKARDAIDKKEQKWEITFEFCQKESLDSYLVAFIQQALGAGLQ